jgi:pimeloyl-ACP methyl ester carboxylesterase
LGEDILIMADASATASTPSIYKKDSVTSSDGTTIGYRQLGQGPGFILVHGGMKSSQDFMSLAQALSDAFTVYLPDRRGRGLSGGYGGDFSVMREVEDLQALMAKTGARDLFGLSGGALVVLRTALASPGVRKAALYEPPLSVGGSAPTSWMPRYERELTQGRLAAAVVTALQGIGTEPLFGKLPRLVLVPLMALIMRLQDDTKGGDVTIRSLVPTTHFEMRNVDEMRDTLQDYRSLRTPTLLLGGGKSPPYLSVALDALAATLPSASRQTFPALGHDGPEDDGRPDLVAVELRKFFLAA